jgi:ABC-2 type transport system ATP-binding protein
MIELKGVTKRYGKTTAIDCISMKLPESGIYCLLGRNGAGKTTFMKLLAGHIHSNDGEITVDGVEVSPGHMPENITFIENGSVQFNMPISKLIDTAADLQEGFDKDFAREMAERFELN